MSAQDLTRWNRAGLSRLRYVDANGAVYYEMLRTALAARFASWPQAAPTQESADERGERLARQFSEGRGDWGLELARELARGTHILTEYLDAYANESALRTATQWDNVRRLVEMLNYHPAPPASAATALIILAKSGKRGRVAKGFAVKHAPAEGGAPIVFETLADLDIDAALNELRLTGYARSPDRLVLDSDDVLPLADGVGGLKIGEPVVLENTETGFTLARLITGITDQAGRTVLRLSGPVSAAAGFVLAETLVHLKPTDRLSPLGPAQSDATAAMLGKQLFLTEEPRALAGGEVIYITDGIDGYYRRVVAVDGKRLRLDALLDGSLRLDRAYVSRARSVSVARVDGRTIKSGGALFSFKVAGDLSSVGPPQTIADFVGGGTAPRLARFEIQSAKYRPPDPNDPASGYTTFTVYDPDNLLENPQAVYFPAVAREWKVDSYLHDNAGGLLPLAVTTSLPKSTSTGDLAVVVSGNQLGWAKLANVAPDPEAGRAELSVEEWHTRASGRFYLSQTRVYGRFKEQVRVAGWNENATPVFGVSLPLAAGDRPELLVIGRKLWIEQRRGDDYALGREATVVDLTDDTIVIAPALDAKDEFTVANTVVRGNVVNAGHGAGQSERILGSGDAARRNQSFLLDIAGVSFIADATLPAGVRADIEVRIDGQRWEQVGALDDSGPGDTHYTVRMTEDGYIRLDFGDGKNGRRLPTGSNNVRVRYRVGTGLAGNVPSGRLEKPTRPHALIDKVRQPLAAAGGGDMEGAEAIKRNAPASVLTLERAVSADDYAHLAQAHAAVWSARAFQRPSRLRSAHLDVVVVPAGGIPLDDRLTAALETFLATHSAPGVDVTVSEFGRVWLHLDIVLRVVSAEYDPEAVKAQAIARLREKFALEQRRIGAPFYLSDVYAAVEAIPGVRNSRCTIAYEREGAAIVGAGQRLSPAEHEVVFLDLDARPGASRIEVEEFEL